MREVPPARQCAWVLVASLAFVAPLLLRSPAAVPADDPFAAMDVRRAAREAPAPTFRLKTPEGRPLALEDQRGKVVAFYFWRTW